MEARAEVPGIQVRFHACSFSMVFSIRPAVGSCTSPERTRLSHCACSECDRMLLNVDT